MSVAQIPARRLCKFRLHRTGMRFDTTGRTIRMGA
jgi:hypothetical protein